MTDHQSLPARSRTVTAQSCPRGQSADRAAPPTGGPHTVDRTVARGATHMTASRGPAAARKAIRS